MPVLRWEVMLKRLLKMGCNAMDWTELAQERDRWRAVVKALLKLRVP
jgi:hypothetical protein